MGVYFLTYGDMLFYVGGYAFYLLSKNQKFFIWIKYMKPKLTNKVRSEPIKR